MLIPGVVDVTTDYLEHPQVIAGTDCGLSTFASYEFVATDVAWAELRALVAGAEIASRRAFG